jgi:ankyrin repeat protein
LNKNAPFGVDEHVLKKRRFSPLHLAVLGIGRSDVEVLLQMGLETHQIDALDVDQRTPLYWSVRKHDVKSTKALLAYGADPGAGVSPIAWACKDPYTGSDLLNILLEAGVDPNSHDGDGHTALHACGIFGRDSHFLHALVSHGAEIDTQYNGPYLQYQGITALGFSALYGHPATLKGLLQLGAYTKVADSEGRTPIHLAIQSVHKATRVECLNALIDAGADLNIRDKKRRNAANTAMSVQDLDCLQVLMSYGGDLTFPLSSKRGEHGNTPYSVLSWPLLEKQNAVVELLLQRLDLLERDPITGYTVLHAIAKYGTSTALVAFENLLSNLTDVSVYPVDIAQYEVNEQLQEHRRFSLFLHRLAERQQATAENRFGPSNRILGRLVDNQAKDVRSSDIEAEYFNALIPHGHAHTKIERDSQQENTTHVGGLSRTTASVHYSVNHIGEESRETVADSRWTRVNTNLSEDTGFKENHNAVTKSVLSLLIGAGSNALAHSGNDVKLATVGIPGMIPSTTIEEEIVPIQDPDSELFQEGWHDENVFAIDKGYHEDTDSGYASDATDIYNSTRIPRPRTPILDVRLVDTLLRRRCVESRTKAADESMQQDDAGESLRQERREQKTEKRNVKVRSISLGYGTFVMARFMIYTIIAIAWSSLKTTHSAFRRSCQRLMRPKLLKDHARITWICVRLL